MQTSLDEIATHKQMVELPDEYRTRLSYYSKLLENRTIEMQPEGTFGVLQQAKALRKK